MGELVINMHVIIPNQDEITGENLEVLIESGKFMADKLEIDMVQVTKCVVFLFAIDETSYVQNRTKAI